MSERKKRGDIDICPNCGTPYQPGIGKCPECGHVYQNVEANHSAQILAKKLEILVSKHKDAYDDGEVKSRNVEIGNCIMTFPIPSDKEDLIEFIASMDVGRKSSVGWVKAYDAKYKECILKAQIMFPEDPQISQIIKLTNNLGTLGKIKMWYNSLGAFMKFWLPFMLGLIIILVVLLNFSDTTQDKISEQLDTLSNNIDNLPIPTKDNMSECAREIQMIIWTPIEISSTEGFNGDIGRSENEHQRKAVQSFVYKKNSYIRLINAEGMMPPLKEDTISNYGY